MKKKSKKLALKCFSKFRLIKFFLGIIVFHTLAGVNAYSLGGNWDTLFTPQGLAPKLSGTERTSQVNFSSILLRGSNMFALHAIQNTSFSVNIDHVQIGTSTDTASWELRSQDNTLLNSGTLAFNQADTISYQHNKTEVVYLYINSGSNGYSLISSNVNIGIFAGTICKFFQNNTREMWVEAPDKVDNFTVTVYSGGVNENAKIKIYDSNGTLVVQGETSSTATEVDITVNISSLLQDKKYKVVINTPSQGILEDFALKVSADIPPVLSLSSSDEFYYAPFGSQEKMSIFINVLMAVANSYTHEEWMVDEAKDAGFNTYIAPRLRTVTLEDVAGWCASRNMKTFYWQRGTYAVSLTDPTYDGKRYYPGTGEEAILSPNSDELWTYLTDIATDCATSSINYPAIQGLFFDFENYNFPTGAGYHQTYLLSYDDVIIGKYETAKNITVSATPPQRKQWLIDNNFHDDFEAFQINHWRDRLSQLRTAVDAINPQFQFIMYPFGNFDTVNRPPFLYGDDAPISRLSSAQSPLALAHYQSYYAPYSIIHDADLQIPKTRSQLLNSISDADDFGTPFMMLAGFDPVCLNFYEFLARAPITGAEVGEGNWVFYEGLPYPSDEHDECMTWFTWSNAKIAAEDYTAAEAVYTTIPSWKSFWYENTIPYLNCAFSSQNNTYSGYNLRETSLIAISCQSGTSVTVKLNFAQKGSYTDPLAWELRTLDDKTIVDRGSLQVGQTSQTITFTPQVTGIYILGVGSGLNTFRVTEINAPFAFYAGKNITLNANTLPLYVNVPAGVANFTLTAVSKWGRQVKLSVYSPTGQLVIEGETSTAVPTKVINVPVGSYGSGAWKIVSGPASSGYYEDFGFTVGPEIPSYVSLSASTLFTENYSRLVFSSDIDEGTGTTISDDSIFGNDGTISGAAWTGGISKNALLFDGIDDYVNCTNDDDLDLNDSRTLSAWIKPDSISTGYNVIVSKNLWGYSLYLNNGRLCGFVAGDPISDQSCSSSSQTVTIGEWQHVAMTFNNEDKKIRLYINGIEVSSYASQTTMTGDPGSTSSFDLCIGSNRGVADYFDGKIDEVRIYGNVRSVQEILEEYKKIVFDAKLNEGTGITVADSSLYGNAGTVTNGASWVGGITGYALSFDGTDDYVNFGKPAELDLPSSRSMSAWIKPDSFSSSYNVIASKNLWGYSLYIYNGYLCGFVAGDPISDQSYSRSVETLTLNEWQHVAMTFDDNDKKVRLYINGREVSAYASEKTMVGSPGSTSSFDLCIGSNRGVADYFDGVIDDVKIFSRVCSEQDIFDDYTKLIFSAPVNEGTGSSVADVSIYKNTGTVYGANWVNGVSAKALSFDGTNDYVDFGNSASLDLSGSRTVSAWIKPDTISGYDVIASKNLWGYSLYLNNGKLCGFVAGDPISDQSCSSSSQTVTVGEWQHVAMTFSDADKQIRLYINGQEVSSYYSQTTMTGFPGSTAAYDLCVGSNRGVADYFDGCIDEVKIFGVARSAQEILNEYKKNIFSVNLDEGSGTSVADTSLYKNNGTVNGASWVSGISGYALSFDGTNDFVDFGNPEELDLPGGRSISAWIKPDTISGSYNTIVAKNLWGYSLMLTSSGQLAGFVAGDPISDQSYSASTQTVTIGQWQHVAMTFDNNDKKVRLYINGTEVSSYSTQITMTGNPGSTSSFNLCIGSDRGVDSYFEGTIDEVSVYNKTLTASEVYDIYQ